MSEADNSRKFDYLDHMVEAITLATSFTESMAKPDFLADRKTQQAVILNLIVLGEAASKIATEFPEFTTAHPALPWQQMRGMRNRMAHGSRHRPRRGLGNCSGLAARSARTIARDH